MKYAVITLLLGTSLFFGRFYPEQFETAKMFVLLQFACIVLPFLNFKEHKKNIFMWALLAFCGSAILSTFLSLDFYVSLWGNPKSPMGWIEIAALIVVYAGMTEVTGSKKASISVIDVMLFCSFIVSAYAICQVTGHDFLQWTGTLERFGFTRPISTIGHPNFMAAYLGMLAPFFLWRIRNTYSKTWKLFLRITFLCSIASILLSLSRGIIIATVAGFAVYFFINRSSIKHFFAVCSALIALFAVFSLVSPQFRNASLNRFEAFFKPGDARIEYPATAIKIWERYPFFGAGTDNFEIAFQHQRSEHYWKIEPNGSPHKAHNDFLNLLATQGLVGATIGIAISIILLLMCYHSTSPFKAPAVAAIVSFYAAGLTSFMVIPTAVIFLISIALLNTKLDSLTDE